MLPSDWKRATVLREDAQDEEETEVNRRALLDGIFEDIVNEDDM